MDCSEVTFRWRGWGGMKDDIPKQPKFNSKAGVGALLKSFNNSEPLWWRREAGCTEKKSSLRDAFGITRYLRY